ncbi:MAG: leucine-rich repeat domain-containing protein [Clostridia bacterium]|nr:leucine-rich repeat domain-containing protein [Clostridia bacterium]
MSKIKKTVAYLVSMLMVFSVCSVAFTASATASGICGDNVSWSIENGMLNITGYGAMYDYPPGSNNTPWQLSEEPYDTIIINYGVTHIGAWAFAFSSVSNVMIPNSVMTIGENAFASINGLTNVTIPGSVTSWPEAFVLCNDLMNVSIEPGVPLIDRMSFGGCENLHYVGIPDSVRTIGQAAFHQCTGLGLITLPSNLETIGPSAFAGSGLLFVEIPDSVTTIGMEAFAGAPLAAVTLPSNLTTIEPGAFAGTALTSIEFPASVTYIGQRAFAGSSLTSVTLPSQLMDIREEVFRDCTELSNVTIPASVMYIGPRAFNGCTSLQSIHIPATVQTIAEDALPYCSMIFSTSTESAAYDYATWHNIPFTLYGADNACGDDLAWSLENGVLTITGLGAMYDYGTAERAAAPWAGETFTQINFPSGITHVGDNAFGGCTAVTDIYYDGTSGYLGSDWGWGAVTIGVNNDPLYRAVMYYEGEDDIDSGHIGSNLIWRFIQTRVDKTNLTAYGTLYIYGTGAMPDYTFTSVGPGGIYDITAAPWEWIYYEIEDVVIESGVTNIGACAFYGCDALKSVTIPDTVTSIGASAFTGCGVLANVYFDGILPQWNAITVGSGNAPLNNATLHYTVLSTDSGACGTDLTWVYDPNTLTLTISGTGAMTHYEASGSTTTAPWAAYAEAMRRVVINGGVTSVGNNAFRGCTGLTIITVGSDVVSIGSGAFSDCSNLINVTIGESVASIGDGVFEGCAKLKAITVDSNNPNYSNDSDGALYNKDKTVLIRYPQDYNRTELNIRDGVIIVANDAFRDCKRLTYISTPESTTTIGDRAFSNCTLLDSVYIRSGVSSIGDQVFDGCESLGGIAISGSNASFYTDPWGILYNKNQTELIRCPEGKYSVYANMPTTVTTIRSSAFLNCKKLTSITISASVTSIGDAAFKGCTGLTSVTIPAGVASIGDSAFKNCTAIANVYYDGTQQQWDVITKGTNNEPLLSATLHCSEAAPNDEYSVTVNDQVALNLMLDLDARGLDDSDVTVTLDGQPINAAITNDGDQYRVSIITAPAQIAAPILVTAGGETLASTSVMDYCLALCSPAYAEYAEEQALAKAILQYGKAANDVFAYSDDEITTIGELDHSAVQAYNGAKFTDGTGKITGASFMALAKPDFRFYMKGLTEAEACAYNQAGITAAYRNANVEEELHARFLKKTVNGETNFLVEVTGVSAENLDEEIVVTIPGLGSFTFNGNAFAKAMANNSDPVTRNFGAALYNYGVAANACFRGEDQP